MNTRVVVAALDQNSYDVDLEAERSAFLGMLEDRRVESGRWLAPLLFFVIVRLAQKRFGIDPSPSTYLRFVKFGRRSGSSFSSSL